MQFMGGISLFLIIILVFFFILFFIISLFHFYISSGSLSLLKENKNKTESWKGIKREKSHEKLDFIGLDLIWIYIAISNPFITGKLGFKDGNNSFEA